MGFLDGTRPMLAAVGLAALFLGLMPLAWLSRRLFRAVLRRPQAPVGGARYFFLLLCSIFFGALGAGALALWLALSTYADLGRKTRIAEVQCIDLGGNVLRLYYVPIEHDGRRGATETYDLRGDEWTVGGDVLRFRPLLEYLHVDTVYQITRVEGRWLKADDANAHQATAHDRGVTGRGWLALYRNGTRGPLGWLIEAVHGQAVSQLPDRRALFDLYITADGLVADKRAF